MDSLLEDSTEIVQRENISTILINCEIKRNDLFLKLLNNFNRKLDIVEFAKELDIDFSTDNSYIFFFSAQQLNTFILDDNFYHLVGHDKKDIILKLLSNKQLNVKKTSNYHIMSANDFDLLIQNIKFSNCKINEAYITIKNFFYLYHKYEQFFNDNETKLCKQQIFSLEKLVKNQFKETNELILNQSRNVENGISREMKKVKKKIIEKIEFVNKEQCMLMAEMKPKEMPVVSKFSRCVALYNIGEQKWYISRRQENNFKRADNDLIKKYPNARLVKKWSNVSNSLDLLKRIKRCFVHIKTMGNIIDLSNVNDDDSDDDINDDRIIECCNSIINEINTEN
ncbi:hypothetical protein SGHV154 [Glossina pallidipes salivary gland hypertrophy virus]|uniref:Uncharacterized protein n=1 Tax=Glossina hytrovirus (isolate Glossina pallidipes/Ethiopia/Seibersdorf/-) TaxID=379529 RepID=B0YLV8_GHVS|nr:hypothetical protein SGHV154 [Glossina pallidipes salivary gland hypertrophy virus]ABQ08927.1 hypothetical protein SGHV154 [Glossina pallidipes salivary gland hypertrophy virus]